MTMSNVAMPTAKCVKSSSKKSNLNPAVVAEWLELSNSNGHSSKPRFNPRLGNIYRRIYMVAFRTSYNSSHTVYAIGLRTCVSWKKLCMLQRYEPN